MTTHEKLSLGIDAIIGIGTICVAILAIWGDKIRYFWQPPSLVLTLRNNHGELTQIGSCFYRYYHLVVTNPTKWVKIENAVVCLTRIEAWSATHGGWQTSYSTGPVPLAWQFQSIYGASLHIGRDKFADIGFVKDGCDFFVTLAGLDPYQGFDRSVSANQKKRFHFRAFADNAESSTLVIEISYTGEWKVGDNEMAKELVIKAVD